MRPAFPILIAALLAAACSQESAQSKQGAAVQTDTPTIRPVAGIVQGIGERPAELLGNMNLETYRGAIGQAALQDFQQAYGACPNPQSVRVVRLDRYRDISDPADPMTTALGAGADRVWRERVQVIGCGTTAHRNLIVANPSSQSAPTINPTLPGDTRVSHGVFPSMGNVVVATAASAVPNCPTQGAVLVHETRLVSSAAAASWTEPWDEQWVLRYCGQMVQANMRFTPTPATGGYAFTSSQARVIG